MQTFLPYLDLEGCDTTYDFYLECAGLLDTKRLGKQRVETMQIMKALLTGKGWVNHPATKMWQGYEWSLLSYQAAVCTTWVEDCGFKDTCLPKTIDLYFHHVDYTEDLIYKDPPWLGDKAFHLAHQSNLLRKDPEYYGKRFPGVPDDLPYIWPVQ